MTQMRTLSPLPPDERPRLTALGLARLLPGVLIVAAGVWWAWLHVPALAAESFWTDELISVGDATYDLIRMLKIQGADIHPPLHTFLLWLLQRLTQSASETTMRLPSLVAVASGMTILGLAAWRRLGAWPAIVFMVLAMSSPLLAGLDRKSTRLNSSH